MTLGEFETMLADTHLELTLSHATLTEAFPPGLDDAGACRRCYAVAEFMGFKVYNQPTIGMIAFVRKPTLLDLPQKEAQLRR